ncbi:transporter substrate-binding domain-containing diguanylate cyclase [Maridesulfovibrio frigidus]|uniref:transporter substrate-binding domain-containing diguanylate cyclase n=1 Tax=Maridesulfovibrio frigidus TaxID=340956 RepID=UPI0004E1B42B|nr:transporter substrate-binding domain-containing protein [Maridesulfovibrio frigidus]
MKVRFIFFVLISFVLLCADFQDSDANQSGLNLNAQEQIFITDHPVIRVANEEDWPPFDYSEFGESKGLSIDYIKLLAEKAGLKIEFVNGYSWAELLALFKEKQIDVIPALYKNSEREAFTLFTTPYYKGELGVFVRDANSNVNNLNDLVGKRVGIQKSHGSASFIYGQIPGIKLIEIDSPIDLVKGLATDKLDAIIGNPLLFYYYAKASQVNNIRLADYVELTKTDQAEISMHVGVRKDWPLLRSILQKALNSVSVKELQTLEDRWDVNPFRLSDAAKISLSKAEESYLAKHPVIRISNEQDYPPYDFAIGKQPQGYSIDLLNMLSKRIGFSIEYVNGYSWEELVGLHQHNKLDLLHTISKTPKRIETGLFSNPFRFYKSHYVVRKDSSEMADIADFKGKVAAVGKGWSQEEFFKTHHPEVELLSLNSAEEMVEAVSNGNADFMVSDIPVMSYLFAKRNIKDLKISGWAKTFDRGQRRTLHFMAHKNEKELISMLNKALASLTPQEIEILERKWFGVLGGEQRQVALSLEEQTFIDENPEIVLGGGISFDPFLIQNDDGSISGYDSDIAKLISKRTGLGIRFELGKWVDVQDKAKRGEVDGISTASAHESRDKYLIKTSPYLTMTSLVIVRNGNPNRIYSVNDLAYKRVALQRGNLGFKKLLDPYLDEVEIVYYDTMHELIRAVVAGDADFTILDETAYYVADQQGLGGFIETTFPIGEPMEIRFYLRNDKPELASIFNKGLRTISEQEKNSIRKRWFGKNKKNFSDSEGIADFTNEEKEYLAKKGGISISVYPDQMPYMHVDGSGQLDGMAADYFSLFEERVGEPFRFLPTRTFEETVLSIQLHKTDVLLMTNESPELRKYVDVTTPYLSFPYVIATTSDKLFIEDIAIVISNNFAVIKDSPIIPELRNMHPFIKIVEVESLLDGLGMVREGKVFGYIDTSAAIGYAIQKELMLDIKIAGKIARDHDFRVATRIDEPLLNSIFQKVVGSLTREDKQRIYNRWVAIKYERGVDYSVAWKVIIVAAILLFASMYWNRKLALARRQIQVTLEDLSAAQSLLQDKNDELEKLAVTDRLTGLGNRMKLDSTLQIEIARNIRYQHSLSVIIMDLDFFKRINDNLGHQAGDKVLQGVAEILRSSIRATDVVGRWGGEEFLIICPDTTLEGANTLAEKIRVIMESTELEEGVTVTGSFGVAEMESGEKDASLIRRADDGLYEAKANGRNRVEVVCRKTDE